MFKPIPGNNDYLISLNGSIRDKNGNVINFQATDNIIKIQLYGVDAYVDKQWLALISIFEAELPKPNLKKLLNIEFLDNSIKIPRQVTYKVMVFKNHVTYLYSNEYFRIIPGFVRYAVSKEGKILDTVENRVLTKVINRKLHGALSVYPEIYIYAPELNSYKYFMIHRLVAMAWCKNTDFITRPIVNHKDGNKSNYHYMNLEWCSFKENSIHAVNTGLRGDNVKCKIRDNNSGQVSHFHSLAQAGGFMGINYPIRIDKIPELKGRLIAKRYELKLESDTTPWFHENKIEGFKLGRYIITCIHKDGSYERFYDSRDFKAKYKLWNCNKIEDLVKKAMIENPDVTIDVLDQYRGDGIQAYNVITGKILETKTLAEMAKITGLEENTVRRLVKTDETLIKNNFAFRYKKDTPWDTRFKNTDKIFKKVLAKNLLTGEENIFESLRKAEKSLKISRQTIKNSMINGYESNNLVFSEIK